MIHLIRPPKPIELTDEVQKELTEEFKKSKKIVWRKKYIVDPLLKMSHDKCCYCETRLNEEGKYMQVEHFHPKGKYPDEVVEWDNLLPSCGRCNSYKRDHNTKREPIINPTKDNPKEYFYLHGYRLKSKNRNEIGKRTIKVLSLNDSRGLVQVRFKLCLALVERISSIEGLIAKSDREKLSIADENEVINGIKDILWEAQPSEEYSAIISSYILNDDSYQYIKQKLIDLNLWDDEHIKLENTAREIMLDITD